MAKPRLNVAVLDIETDPFKHGEEIAPFACEFYSANEYMVFWGEDCVPKMAAYLRTLPIAYLIYAHNGGKFDIVFFGDEIENPVKVIGSRIVSCRLGKHELRDSFAIVPVAQSEFEKTIIDYNLFKRHRREANKTEILLYLHDDCVGLYKIVRAFQDRFGDHLTVGGTAMSELKKIYYVGKGTKDHDDLTRPFYYGGRVECFESGVIEGDWHVYDVNSMYPYVMHSFDHPDGKHYFATENDTLDKRGRLNSCGAELYFAHVHCDSLGAFPQREKGGGISFPHKTGEFWVCSHEIRAALRLGLVRRVKIISALVPRSMTRFNKYVDKFSADKIAAKKAGDKIAYLFAKFMLNSAYGKFGQNPENYKEFLLVRDVSERPGPPWVLDTYTKTYELWSMPADSGGYYDVAVAASITSASRAVLMEGIALNERVAYCDTDSIIIDGKANGISLHDDKLGAWKLECKGDTLCIAGKKLYSLFDNGKPVKSASKGVHITPQQVAMIASGETATWQSEAPSIRLGKKMSYITRHVRKTV
jgi:hypothetical protein